MAKLDIEHYEALWKKLCKLHMADDGRKLCYTTKCPFAKKYCCYNFANFTDFYQTYTYQRKMIKQDLTMVAKENGWI